MKVGAGCAESTPERLLRMPSWLINRTHVVSYRLVSEGFAAAGSHGYHYRLLAALAEFGPSSQAALGRSTGMDRSDVVAAVNELAEQGLVKRAPDADDRRRNTVSLTPAGRKRLTALDHVLEGVQDRLLGPLTATERRQLVKLLTRVLEHHGGT